MITYFIAVKIQEKFKKSDIKKYDALSKSITFILRHLSKQKEEVKENTTKEN